MRTCVREKKYLKIARRNTVLPMPSVTSKLTSKLTSKRRVEAAEGYLGPSPNRTPYGR